ncbi:hypothetical protein PWT90_10810 [Aphanocladium album]|nr:hypothetical protein PWT90_10810 [Aphanocladium album]
MRFFTPLLAAAIAGTAHAMPASTLLQGRADLTLPSRDPFYWPEGDLSGYKPGEILQQRSPPASVAAFGIAPVKLNKTQQLLYRTSDNHGNATATVATVLVPHNADLGKVLSYQIAVDAASIDCAPSYVLQQGSERGPLAGSIVSQAEFLLIEAALEEGWVVVVPDFQGPKSSYLANKLAGYATLDGIRATLASGATTGVKSDARVTMWGYSGGSLASQWAAELQPAYAPDLKIAGAAVGGTVPSIANVIRSINGQPLAGFIPTGVLGLASQYPEAASLLGEALKDDAKPLFYSPLQQCLAANAAKFAYKDVLGMFKDRNFLLQNEKLVSISEDNSLGKATPSIPLFWYKSVMDEVSPVGDSDKLADQYCRDGASVEYVRDLASNHGSYAINGGPLAFSWLKKVMNGQQGVPRSGCSKRTQLSAWLDPAQWEVLPKLVVDALLDLLGKRVGPI